jgi:hypothetical protein
LWGRRKKEEKEYGGKIKIGGIRTKNLNKKNCGT